MTPQETYLEILRLGARIEPVGDGVRIVDPNRAVPPRLYVRIKKQHAELALLARSAAPAAADVPVPVPETESTEAVVALALSVAPSLRPPVGESWDASIEALGSRALDAWLHSIIDGPTPLDSLAETVSGCVTDELEQYLAAAREDVPRYERAGLDDAAWVERRIVEIITAELRERVQ